MESQNLTIRAQKQLSMSDHWGLFHGAKVFHFMVVLLFTPFGLATGGSCSMYGIQNPVESDRCGSYYNFDAGSHDVFVGDVSSDYVVKNPLPHLSLKNVCSSLELFCFPSTLPGFLSEEHCPDATAQDASRDNFSCLSDYGTFKLLNGRSVSCSLNSQEENHDVSSCTVPLLNQETSSFNLNENSEVIELGFLDGSSSPPHIEVSPPLLDWGHKYLYFPSLAYLTVTNTHSKLILNVYEPFSTNTQFYPCNSREVLLGPGEVDSICFVFLPTLVGQSSAHLVLQTSFGGFMIQAKGFGIESPYGIRPLIGLDNSHSGGWRKYFSLFNPSDESLYVGEVTAWISVSVGNASYSTKAVCSFEDFQGPNENRLMSIKERLDVRNGQNCSPLMAMRSRGNWEIGPRNTGTIIGMDLNSTCGRPFGAFCMKFKRSSEDKTDTVIIPIEEDLGGKLANDDSTLYVSVSLEVLVPCDDSGKVVAVSLKNGAPYLLNVVKISGVGENIKLFKIKFMEGLILFPGSVTQVALVSYTPAPIILDNPPEIPDKNMNCIFYVLTNDSRSPHIKIPCKDIINIYSRHQVDSNVGQNHQSEKVQFVSARTGPLSSPMRLPTQSKALETAEADELVLRSWKSQGTTSGMSVLDISEILFPMVQVGSHSSKWIVVKNPSQKPVVMQLILNSAEIVDDCKAPNELLRPSSSSSSVHSVSIIPSRSGFSIAESALTEAYVHPHDTASFGPIFFHPSSQCGWRSSALISNNLSGVEWLSLQGFGGSHSLVLFEGSEAVQGLDFKLNLPSPLNFTPDLLLHVEETEAICSQRLWKELYVKNTGDFPLEVRRVEVSGTECGINGFVVHNCRGFALEPGESTKLQISFQSDFFAAVMQRDLELTLSTGIVHVIPMTATLPILMLNLCKKSSVPILLVASMVFLAFFFVLALGSENYLFKSGRSSIATIIQTGKRYSHLPCDKKNSNKVAVSSKMNGFLRAIEEEENLITIPQPANPTLENQKQSYCFLGAQKETTFPFSAPSKSVKVESSDIEETPKPSSLTVRTGKEKGRRRRKKRNSRSGLSGLLEVSSSHSGNSTPSSPLSPLASFTPKWSVDQSIEIRNPFSQVGKQQNKKILGSEIHILEPEVPVKHCSEDLFLPRERSIAPRKNETEHGLMHSATFPPAGRPSQKYMCSSSAILASTSTIAPHAHAPGSKLYNKKIEEKTGFEDQFKYDIWGDHLFELNLIGRSKEVSAIKSGALESSSFSFFVSGPQTLVGKSQSRSVSGSHQEI